MKAAFKTDGPEAPDGTPWWLLRLTPGTKAFPYGGVKRIAAYLNFNLAVGDVFTMRDLREELGTEGVAETAEHFNRRLRELRPDSWTITSYKDDRSLAPDTYRLDAVGRRVWLGERNQRDKVSGKTRRLAFERDANTCMVCGIVRGDAYDDDPERLARLTIGHRVPGERLGGADLDEVQTECSRCNEPARDVVPDPETLAEVLPEVRSLKRTELIQLKIRLDDGRRVRSKGHGLRANSKAVSLRTD